MTEPAGLLAFVEELARAGRATALRVKEQMPEAENKAKDGRFDPVTEADRETERTLRTLIEARFPDHGIDGEEFGHKPAEGPYRWSLDPIDGTRAFICGLPSWTILIALLEGDRPILGAIDVPSLDELYLGHGEVALLVTASHRARLRTSRCRTLEEARFTTTDPYLFTADEMERFELIRAEARLTRYGLDGYGYARLAAGSIDLVVETGLAPHDIHALIPVITAAGGIVTDWKGGSDWSSGKLIAAATAELNEQVVARFT